MQHVQQAPDNLAAENNLGEQNWQNFFVHPITNRHLNICIGNLCVLFTHQRYLLMFPLKSYRLVEKIR